MDKKIKNSALISIPENLSGYVDEITGIYLILDDKGMIVFLNEEGRRILGIKKGTGAGKNWIKTFIPEKDRKKISAMFNKIVSGNLKMNSFYENKIVSADGKIHTIEWKNSYLRDAEGKIKGIISFGVDITLDRLAQKTLIDGEERYRNLFNNIGEAIIMYNRDKSGLPGKIFEVNETACKKTGFSRADFQKINPIRIFHTDDRKKIIHIHKKMAEKDEKISLSLRILSKKGEFFPAFVNFSTFKFHNLNMVIASVIDLSAEIKTRNELEQSEGKYRVLFDVVGDMVAVARAGKYGRNWTITEVNDAVEKMLGYTREQFIGLKLKDIVVGGTGGNNMKLFKNFVKSGRVMVEIGLKSASGSSVMMEIRGHLVKTKTSREFVAVCRDITERKITENVLDEQNRFNRGRALILEKSNFSSGDTHKVIGELISAGAETLGCSRAFWSEISDGVNYFPVEWAKRGLRKVMSSVRLPHYSEYDGKYTAGLYNTDMLISKAGKGLKTMMKIMMPAIKKRLGVSEAMAIPCYINDKLAGTMVFCSLEKNFWTETKQEFAKDCAKITGMAVQKMLLEKSIVSSEEKYRMLFENTGDPVLVNSLNPDGTPSFFYEVNETALREYGYTKEEFLKMKPEDIIADYDDKEALEIVKVLEEKGHVSFETISRHSSGAQSPAEVKVHQFNINNQKFYLTTVRDISQRKKMEKALMESEMYYKALTEESSDVIMVIDEGGVIKYVSHASLKLLEYLPEELEGQNLTRFLPGLTPDKGESLVNGAVKNMEVRAKTRDNKLVVLDVTSRRMFDNPAVKGMVLNMRDITIRKKTEDQMKKVIWQLEQTNAELEQFAYVASHDLKEPLRMISNYLELIQMRHKNELSGEMIEFMDYAMSGTKRMFELIQALLTYSRIGRKSVEMQDVDLNKIVDLLAADFSIALGGGKVIHGNLPVIRSNKIEMTQLFTNLIGNAVKFHSDRLPVIQVTAQTGGEDWIITVADNGIGVEKQYAERVFGLFERLHSDSEYAGTGIGLTICRKIVMNLGGRIWLESEVGEGTKVKFTIPIRRETNE